MALKLGRLTATRSVWAKMADDTAFHRFVLESVCRYDSGDWGELSESD